MRPASTTLASPLSAHFNDLNELNTLLQRVQRYAELGEKFADEFPPLMRKNVQFSSIDGVSLRFLANSSAWATKLRLLSDTLIAKAQGLGYQHVSKLKIRVQRIE